MILRKIEELGDIWCPYVRLICTDDGSVLSNRGDVVNTIVKPSTHYCKCIGPGCALWEWYRKDESGYCGAIHSMEAVKFGDL